MNREEALERVRGILVEQLGVDEEQVTEDASFQGDLDADSLDLVELIMELRTSSASRSPTRMHSRSRPWARRSTTSSRTAERPGSTSRLRELIDGLPAELREAVFTHSSWHAERARTYERLEFLGDGVLGLAIAHHLYRRLPDRAEGSSRGRGLTSSPARAAQPWPTRSGSWPTSPPAPRPSARRMRPPSWSRRP